MTPITIDAAVLEKVKEALENIAKRPDLPNPDRDADWKNCQKWSSHEAKEALTLLESAQSQPGVGDEAEALESMPEYHSGWTIAGDPTGSNEDEILREWFAKHELTIRAALLAPAVQEVTVGELGDMIEIIMAERSEFINSSSRERQNHPADFYAAKLAEKYTNGLKIVADKTQGEWS